MHCSRKQSFAACASCAFFLVLTVFLHDDASSVPPRLLELEAETTAEQLESKAEAATEHLELKRQAIAEHLELKADTTAEQLKVKREATAEFVYKPEMFELNVSSRFQSDRKFYRFTASTPPESCLRIFVSDELAKGRCSLGRWSIEIRKSSLYPGSCTFALDDSTVEVKLNGAAHIVPPLNCDGSTCFGVFDIRDPGAYELSIRIAEFIEPSSFQSFQCFSRDNQELFVVGGTSPVRLEFTAVAPSIADISVSSTSASTADKSSPSTCHPSSFYSGRWVRRKTKYSLGPQSTNAWEPYEQCDWPAFRNHHQHSETLRGRWVLLLGDSTMQEIAFLLIKSVFGSFNPKWNKLEHRGQPQRSRFMDTGFSEQGTRISFLWAACPIPRTHCDFVGSLTVLNGTFQQYLSSLLLDKRPDALVYNSGLHDLARYHYLPPEAGGFTTHNYQQDLHKALQFVGELAPRRLWKSTSPKVKQYECGGFHGGTRGDVIRMNRVAGLLATAHGFEGADQHPLNEALWWSVEGHHCENQAPCNVFTLSLHNYFYHWWGRSPPS